MDRYGFRPLYRSGDDISPSLLALPRSGLDWDALAVFIRLGFFIGASTPFRNIRYAGPEPWLTKPSNMSRSAAIEGYGELFRTAVRQMIPEGDIVLPLSGGRDCRHILFELLYAGVRPRTVTTPRWAPTPKDDVMLARVIAGRFGLRHIELRAEWRKIRAERENHTLTDFCADEHAWMLPLWRYMQEHGGTVFDGIAGDVLSAGLYLNKDMLAVMQAGDVGRAADILLGPEKWADILDPALYKELSRERAAVALERELAKHLNAPNPVSSFIFWNRTRREMSFIGARIFGGARMPYLDDAVYDHLTGLPASYFLDGAFHTETIHRIFPQHADIPYDSNKITRRAAWQRFRLFALTAEVHRLLARSRWIRRRLLTRKTRPEDVARMLYLLDLERLVSRCPKLPPAASTAL